MKRYFYIAMVFICLSCTSTGKTADGAFVIVPEPVAEIVLPLGTGWYQYNFERTFKGVQDEYEFAQNTGMKMVQELTWKYTGVVCRFEDGVFYDPVTGIELLIDGNGRISCAENVSIKGELETNGRFVWSGLTEEHGRLNTILVKGTIIPLPASIRGGPEFDGVYRMTDMGTGRAILAKIENGFYTWSYHDFDEAGFTPWPTLVSPDGSFSFSMDLTNVAEMGELFKSNYTTGFVSEGKVIPGQGISLEEVSRSSGLGQGPEQGNRPQIYAGTVIRSGDVPNESVPAGIESLVAAGRAVVRAVPKPSREQYPAWYLNFPSKPGFIYAAGEKTFADKDIAFAMAEAAAAANLADQVWVRIESSITDISDAQGTRVDERIRSESLQQLNYRIIERVYNDRTGTAFVLAEIEL